MHCKFKTFKFTDSTKGIVLDIYDNNELSYYILSTFEQGFYKIKYTVRSSSEQDYINFLIKEQLVIIEHFNKDEEIYKLKLTPKALLNVL
jgi:hypothetical protein